MRDKKEKESVPEMSLTESCEGSSASNSLEAMNFS